VASPGPTSPPSAAHTGPPYPLNGWPAAYSGNQLLSAQAAGDSLSSSALQESQTFYDAQSVINSITQSMIASTHSFFDYVYGQVRYAQETNASGSSIRLLSFQHELSSVLHVVCASMNPC
jgi:hypothetical protein